MAKYNFDPETYGIVLFVNVESEDNIRRIKMVLDTGATYVLIPWKIAEELGYKPAASKEWAPITTPTAVINAPVISLKSITTLGLKANNVKVICHDLPEISRVDGLLGLSYLKNFKLILDFKNGILELE